MKNKVIYFFYFSYNIFPSLGRELTSRYWVLNPWEPVWYNAEDNLCNVPAQSSSQTSTSSSSSSISIVTIGLIITGILIFLGIITFVSIVVIYKIEPRNEEKQPLPIETYLPCVNIEEVDDHFEQNNCTICLNDLKSERSHRIIKACGHLFHSNWIQEYFNSK